MPTEGTLFLCVEKSSKPGSQLEGFHWWPSAGLHVEGPAFTLGIAFPSELHCSDAWTVVALVLMAAGFYLVSFVMLMVHLMQRYAELEATEGQLRQPLAEGEDGAGRSGGHGRRALYNTLTVVYFILFAVAIARISRSLACHGR